MKSADLHKIWSAPDNSRLTAKQASFRLPVHVAAKINALAEFYPTKTKTEIVGDLLAAALEDLIASIPAEKGPSAGNHPEGGMLYEARGPLVEFRKLANKHYRDLERELGNKSPPPLYAEEFMISEDQAAS